MSSLTRSEQTSAAVHPVAQKPESRLAALDGLRGIAAVVVVLYHLFLVAEPVLRRQGGSGVGSPLWWVSQTPLKLATAGSEAVLVFFVLSGLVVALPALRRGGWSWSAFLGGRLARLYLPVWASICIGTVLVWLIPRRDSAVSDGTWMDNSQATSTSWSTVLTQASLTGGSYDINNVLWSLRWELLFSALLPLFVALATITARYWLIALTAAIALTVIGVLQNWEALRYLPVFFIGTLMAVRLQAIREWTRRRLARRHSALWCVTMTVVPLILISAQWVLRPIIAEGTLANLLLGQLSVLGAAGVVLAAIGVPRVRMLLEAPATRWLGSVSFSLYLIHMPILATVTFLLGEDRWWLVALITVPLALLAAWGFHCVVESPSQRLARRISRIISGKLSARRARSTT